MVHLLSNTMVRLSWLTLATLSVLTVWTPAARSASLGSPPSDSRQAEASAVGVVGGVGGVAGGGGGGGVGGVAGGGDVAVSGVDVGYNSQLTDQLFGDELAPIVFDSLPFYLQDKRTMPMVYSFGLGKRAKPMIYSFGLGKRVYPIDLRKWRDSGDKRMAGRSADRFRFGLGKRSASGAEDLADAGVGDDDDDGAVVEGEAEELAAAAAADDDDDAGDANDVAVVAKRDRLRSSGYYTIFLPHQYLSYFDAKKGRQQQPMLSLTKKRDRFYVSGQTPTLSGGAGVGGDAFAAGKRWPVYDFGLGKRSV